jgi:ferredoxin-NADP reductase
MSTETGTTLTLRVMAMRHEAQGVLSVELGALDDAVLPPVAAGAHVDLHLEAGLVRSYSLVVPRCSANRYVVAVLLDRASRGGSAHVHQQLRVGDTLQVGRPRNHFSLVEDAAQTVLVGGGIGITPIYSMFARQRALGRNVALLYAGRSRAQMALRTDIEALGGHVTWHVDDEAGGPPDLRSFLSGFDANAHFYCCGPGPMMDNFESLCETLGLPHVHMERFAPAAAAKAAAPSGGYEVELVRSKKTLRVAPGQTMYDLFIANQIKVEFSCKEGICGTCETRVLAGLPDHRDSVLSKAERATNKTMMVCVSGCQGEKLSLDL